MTNEEAMRGVALLERGAGVVEVRGVAYDSRRVVRGDAFVAMRGESTDGNRFVADALARGASVVVTDAAATWERRGEFPGVVFYRVERGRRALAGVAANVFGHPERKLALSAVTGTNGKTTTAYLLEAMLRSVGRKSVMLGTIEYHVGDVVRVSPHTTPESRDVLELFAEGVAAGATEAVMEMSSHALEQERVWGLPVDVAIFTNLTQDHLDYHGSMEAYARAKARLFEGVGAAAPRVAVINADDAYADAMRAAAGGCEVWSYGVEGQFGTAADFCAENVIHEACGTCFDWKTPAGTVAMRSPLVGHVNVYNLQAAGAAALARGLRLEEVAASAASGAQVPGRFQVVPSTSGVTVVVDYAHTEDALRNLVALGRAMVRGRGGRVITLFGCGGDRDRTKRPRMGRAAGEGSDVVVLTSDNPRSEDPAAIVADVFAGVRETAVRCIVEEDRARAIALAIGAARRGDIVLLAGKGHEKVQILGEATVPFDDVAVAAAVLREVAG